MPIVHVGELRVQFQSGYMWISLTDVSGGRKREEHVNVGEIHEQTNDSRIRMDDLL